MIIISDNSIIHKIYHISDLHFRRYDRQVEYTYVCNNLYKYLKEVSDEHSIIVITGDVLHAKDNLTPDCIINVFNFFKSLTDIMPVILIAGNHDMVMTNTQIKDSLSAILTEHSIKNIHYLRDSGIYKYGNIIFGVSSLYDNKFINANDINYDDEILIGLYHGPVGACSTSVGVILNGDKKISDFDGYDYVLLGDIHKFQYMNEDKTIAYASSLISQNFAEVDDYHGVLVWDLINKNSEYKIIDNPYRHISCEINNGQMFINNNNIDYVNYTFPLYGKIRLNIINTSKIVIDLIKKTIKKKFNHVVFYESFIENKINIDNNESEEIDINLLLNKYISKLSEEEQLECKNIFSAKLNDTTLSKEKQCCQWNLLDLEFSNLFAYGENNKLNFTKLPNNEIVGLFAPNSHGKSSLIDIILFSLYENFSRNVDSRYRTIPSYIVNNNKNWFETKIRFKLGSDIYTIHKKGKVVGKNSSKTGKTIQFQINSFFKNDSDNLTRKDRFETQKEIDNIIGNYDDFCLTTLFLQNKEKNFYDMKSVDRKEFLYNLLSLEQFNKMYDDFKQHDKIAKIKFDDLKHQIESMDIDNINENIKSLNKQLNKINKTKNKFIISKNKYNKIKNSLIKKINNDSSIINNTLIDNKLNFSHILLLKEYVEICNLINNSTTFQYINTFNTDLFINIFIKIGKIDLTEDNYNIDNLINDNNIFKKSLSYKLLVDRNYQIYLDTQIELNIIKEQIIQNEININCNVCLKRRNILDKLKLEHDILLNKIDELTKDFPLGIGRMNMEEIKNYYYSIFNKYNENKIKIYKYINNLAYDIKNKYSSNFYYNSNNDYKFIEYLRINIKYLENKKIINKLNKVDRKINYIDEKLNNINNTSNKISFELATFLERQNSFNKIKNDYIDYSKKYNIYSALKKATHINGIPSTIISTKLSEIQHKVNLLIAPFINKNIKIVLDSNNILVHILDSNNDIINILGGMEMFIINIAFKIALANVSVLPKNRMIIIDEGVSVLDKEHIDKFDKIAEFLNSNYNNVILISHIDSLKDYISEYINIRKEENFSIIFY
jgi:DNA repair exonuclease SbcCD ATPase subunit